MPARSAVLPSFLSFAPVLFAFCEIAAAQPATIQRTIEGRTLNLVVPEGYCAWDRDTPAGQAAYSYMERLNEGRNLVILMFAACDEVRMLQQNPGYRIRRHGIYMAPLAAGRPAPVPPGQTRAMFIAEMKQSMTAVANQMDEINKQVNDRARELERAHVQTSGLSMRYLDDNTDALYIGLGSWLEVGAQKVRIVAVMGMTQMTGVVFSSYLYADAGPNDTFEIVLDRSRRLMREVAARNR